MYLTLTLLAAVGWVWAASTVTAATALRSAPWAGLAAVIGWLVFGRPKVRIDTEAVTITNPLRTVTIPWAALVNISTKFAATFQTPAGRYVAWAAPGPGRHVVLASSPSDVRMVAEHGSAPVALGALPKAASGVVAHRARTVWHQLVENDLLESGAADHTPVTTQVAWPWVITVVALLGAAVSSLLV